MLAFPAQAPPMLKAFKDFTHWSSAMRAYLMGGFFWPYAAGIGYGKEPENKPGADASPEEQSSYEAAAMHFLCNNVTGKELLFQAVGEDASAGYRDLETLKEVWEKLHEDRAKGDSRKLVEAVHTLTHTPYSEGSELEWFGKLEKATASLNRCLGIHNCGECKAAGRITKLEEFYGALVMFKLPEKFALQKALLQRGEEKHLALSNVKREVILALGDASTQSTISAKTETTSTAPTGAFAAQRPTGGGENFKGSSKKNGKGKNKLECTFCGKPNHTVERCWNKKAAEYYKTHGTTKFFDPRGEATDVNANGLDAEYDAMLSVPTVNSGNGGKTDSFSSEYLRVCLVREVKELRQNNLITKKLAQKMLAMSASDLSHAQSHLILDSGAALHLIGTTRAYKKYRKLKQQIEIKGFGSEMSANAIGVGSITICPRSRSNLRRALTVNDVHYVPGRPYGLLSYAVMLDNG